MLRVEREESGREILVAATDIKPGALLFTEAPLMTIKFRCVQFDQGYHIAQTELEPGHIRDGFETATSEQKEKYLQIYAPNLDPLRSVLRTTILSIPDMKNRVDHWVKVCMIFQCNCYHRPVKVENGVNAAIAVYEMMSKVKHSCIENVARVKDGDEKFACRAICHIKAGEPLTISHVEDRALEPIYSRRFSFMKLKGFTCHCPRCDAEGDDTRQFDCFDPACQGRHYMREPISKQPLPIPGQEYEGVTDEEPRLLACTVCKRHPPVEYVQRALNWEQCVNHRIKDAYWQAYEASQRGDGQAVGALIHSLLDVTPPRHHAMANHLCYTRTRLLSMDGILPCVNMTTAVQRSEAADLHAVKVVEEILPGAHPELLNRLTVAALSCTEGPQKKELLQKCLRVSLILRGRETRESGIDTKVLSVLTALPQWLTPGLAVCAFCEESPDNAELKLSRCGACKMVAYCRKGCQKAHWPLHKQQCGRK